MVEKINNSTTSSIPDVIKLFNKKLENGRHSQHRPKHCKGNRDKKSAYQSSYIGETDELESNMFTYDPTMEKDYVGSSKEVFYEYTPIRYRLDVKESLKKGK